MISEILSQLSITSYLNVISDNTSNHTLYIFFGKERGDNVSPNLFKLKVKITSVHFAVL